MGKLTLPQHLPQWTLTRMAKSITRSLSLGSSLAQRHKVFETRQVVQRQNVLVQESNSRLISEMRAEMIRRADLIEHEASPAELRLGMTDLVFAGASSEICRTK